MLRKHEELGLHHATVPSLCALWESRHRQQEFWGVFFYAQWETHLYAPTHCGLQWGAIIFPILLDITPQTLQKSLNLIPAQKIPPPRDGTKCWGGWNWHKWGCGTTSFRPSPLLTWLRVFIFVPPKYEALPLTAWSPGRVKFSKKTEIHLWGQKWDFQMRGSMCAWLLIIITTFTIIFTSSSGFEVFLGGTPTGVL